MNVAHFSPLRRADPRVDDSPNTATPGLPSMPHDDAGPKLNAILWVLSTVSGILMAARLYAKRVRCRAYWWDDWLLLASWVVNVVAISVITYCISLGLGKHTWDVDPGSFAPMFKAFTVAATLSIVASIWSKTSFALTILRLTDGWLKGVVWFLIGSVNVAMGVTALLNWIHCTPVQRVWDFQAEGTCWPFEIVQYYDVFSAAYSGVVDISLVMIAWKLLLGLQMHGVEKIGATIAMSMGVLAGATSFVKAVQLRNMSAFSRDVYDGMDILIWSNAEITVTIMAASIPVLRAMVYELWSTSSQSSRAMSEIQVSQKTDSACPLGSSATLTRQPSANPNPL